MKMHLGRHALLTKQLFLVGKTVLYWVTDTLVLHKFSLKSFSYGKHIQLLCTCFKKCTEDLHLPASCKTVDVMFWFCKSNKLWIAVCQGNSSPWVNWIIRENWTYIVTSVKESRPAESGFLSLNSVQDTKNWKLKFVLKRLCNDLVAFRM